MFEYPMTMALGCWRYGEHVPSAVKTLAGTWCFLELNSAGTVTKSDRLGLG